MDSSSLADEELGLDLARKWVQNTIVMLPGT